MTHLLPALARTGRLRSALLRTLFLSSLPVTAAGLLAGCGNELAGDAAPGLERSSSELNVAQFHGWVQIPNGTVKTGPSIAAVGANAEHVCALGMDNRVWCNYWTSLTNWVGWNPIGNNTFSMRPGVAAFSDGSGPQTAYVAVTSAGTAMINSTITVGVQPQLQGWTNIPGGTGFVQPVAILNTSTAIHVFGVRANNRLYYATNFVGRTLDQTRWTAWQEVPGGGLFNSAVAATSVVGGLALAGRGLDDRIWVTQGTLPSTVNGWHQLAGVAQVVAPGITSRSANQVDVFGEISTDTAGHVATVNPSFASTPIFDTIAGGNINTPIAATARTSANLDIVARRSDNAVWINRWF